MSIVNVFTKRVPLVLALLCIAGAVGLPLTTRVHDAAQSYATTTPIKHVVIIFQENVSFDHYFATYPHALNLPGEVPFHAKAGTPTVNGLEAAGLLTVNPNSTQPFRLTRSTAITGDQDHGYTDEQRMFHGGLMDKFVESNDVTDPSVVMAYFDGNTVTALWNYAQNFAMSDNSFGTGFGPSSPGAVNLISGSTQGAILSASSGDTTGDVVSDGQGGLTLIDDAQPTGDSATNRENVSMGGLNVGNLCKTKGITWGWFQGGFADTSAAHTAPGHSASKVDYIPHHAAFQYYPSTANPTHKAPSSINEIGHDGQANHNYDLTDFWNAVDTHRMPAVSYLKAAGYQDGHAGYSDPLAEQTFLVETINHLMSTPEWESTAIIICYDDSDGWYDHQMGPIVSKSHTPYDALLADGDSGTPPASAYQGRCGYGPRLPLLVVSPFAKKNFVDHGVTDQSSTLRFIEDNWSLGRIGNQSFDAIAGKLDPMFDFEHGPHPHRLFLDPTSGQPLGE
jgi:phospholipase C